MVNGSMILITGMSGCRMPVPISNLMLPMGIGYIRMRVGPGLPIIPGAGPLSTMAAGSSRMVMDGCGSRVRNGLLPG